MKMNNKHLMFTKLKTQLSERIKSIYQSHLGHQPGEITYQIFPDKLVIVMENSVTRTEKFLSQNDQEKLAREIRVVLNKVFQSQWIELIETSMEVTIVDFLFDTTISTGRTGAIAIFDLDPKPLAVDNGDEEES